MKGKELLDANPKAASLIHDFYLDAMLNALDDQSLPDNFKEFTREKGLPMENIAAMIDANPRQLFDVFDSHKIYPNVVPNFDGTFLCSIIIGNTSATTSRYTFNTRKEADYAVIKDAILELEERLTDLVNDKENS